MVGEGPDDARPLGRLRLPPEKYPVVVTVFPMADVAGDAPAWSRSFGDDEDLVVPLRSLTGEHGRLWFRLVFGDGVVEDLRRPDHPVGL